MKRQRVLTLIILFVLTVGLALGVRFFRTSGTIAEANIPLVVSAAASLTDALKELEPLYQLSQSNITVRYNFASSGALQQQIENGAPADIFISAAAKQMDALQKKNLLSPDTQRNLLTNQLVLIVPNNTSSITDLQSLLNVGAKRIAIGDPRSVPVGQYAQEALIKSGLWEPLKSNYVLANNVRQVLQFVESGNADAGLVYLTDAKTTNNVKIAQIIPASMHSPIVYPIAVLKNSRHQTASKHFVQFLFSDQAKQVFQKYGFNPA